LFRISSSFCRRKRGTSYCKWSRVLGYPSSGKRKKKSNISWEKDKTGVKKEGTSEEGKRRKRRGPLPRKGG